MAPIFSWALPLRWHLFLATHCLYDGVCRGCLELLWRAGGACVTVGPPSAEQSRAVRRPTSSCPRRQHRHRRASYGRQHRRASYGRRHRRASRVRCRRDCAAPPVRTHAGACMRALRCIALWCIALHCVALHCVALHCFALRCVALHCVALHCAVALRLRLRLRLRWRWRWRWMGTCSCEP